MNNNLYVIMAEKQLTIKDVVEHTGLSRGIVSSIKNKKAKVFNFDNLKKLCDYLNVPLHELIDYQPKGAKNDN